MIHAVIFDLDGVLVSTDEYHYRSWKRLCEEEGFTFFNYEFNHKFRGVARLKCVEILLNAAGKSPTHEEILEIAERKNRYFNELLEQVTENELLPGALETLQELKKQNIKTAVASNSKNAKPIIEKVNIARYLDVIVDGYDITHNKPHPEPFLLAAHRLNVEPKDCLVVEDAVAGVEAAFAAGMKVLGIGDREYLPNAPHIVKNLSMITVEELLNL
ncbi:MAG: beta-phosphoglucomutase [Bacteroidetes bacterium]|nr:beta-phosphoglucomutase [Bacteroidota bacterium]